MYACVHSPEAPDTARLAGMAQEFSPMVEATRADSVTLNVSGLERIFG